MWMQLNRYLNEYSLCAIKLYVPTKDNSPYLYLMVLHNI